MVCGLGTLLIVTRSESAPRPRLEQVSQAAGCITGQTLSVSGGLTMA